MKARKARLLLVLLMTLLVSLTVGTQGLAAGPLSELYFYNHGEVGGLHTLDTTSHRLLTEYTIDNIGYDCKSYVNIPAGPASSGSVIRTLASDAVFHISCHAGPGRMATVSNGQITRLSAKAVADDAVYSLAYNFDNTTNKLKKIKVAYWLGCNTYGTDSTYGSLNQKSIDLGVDAAITHTDETYPSRSNLFAYKFYWYLYDGVTVSQALLDAKAFALSQYNNDAEVTVTVKTYVSGSSSTKIVPAAYGS